MTVRILLRKGCYSHDVSDKNIQSETCVNRRQTSRAAQAYDYLQNAGICLVNDVWLKHLSEVPQIENQKRGRLCSILWTFQREAGNMLLDFPLYDLRVVELDKCKHL